MTDTETTRKKCLECGIRESPQFPLECGEDYVAVLYHYLDEHTDSDVFRDVVENQWIETNCSECEQPFFAPMKLGHQGLHCEAFCPECAPKEPVRPLIAREVSPEEFIEHQAVPGEDSLSRTGEATLEVLDDDAE